MVFFTCSHCGDSIKKPSVAKHYQTVCRNKTPFLTCVDCLKDFKGNEYEAHTKCFTEEERYSAKGFVPKASSNKGERKQKAWSECVQGLLSTGNLKHDEKSFLHSIAKYDNIPRKKVKFMNFLKTTARNFCNNQDLIDRVWDKLEGYFKESNTVSEPQQSEAEPGKENQLSGDQEMETEEVSEKKKKKRKHDGAVPDSANEKVPEPEKEGDKKKKKRKKNSGEEEITALENEPDMEVEETKKKKKDEETNGVDETARKKSKKSKKGDENGDAAGTEAADDKENVSEEKKSKKKKKKIEEENGMEGEATQPTEQGDRGNQGSFDWAETIRGVLTESGEMPLKKLQKKVLKKYCKVFGCEVTDKTVKKFTKKLGKVDGVTVSSDTVTLST